MHHEKMGSYILALFMQGLMYHVIACTCCIAAGKVLFTDSLKLLAVFIPLFLFAFIREKTGNFFLFIFLHIAVSGSFLLIMPGVKIKAVLGICMAIMAVHSVYVRTKPEYEREECPPIAAVFLFLLIYLIGIWNEQPFLQQLAYYETFLFLMLFAAHRSLENTAEFLHMNKGMANLPVKQIAGMNKMLLGVFLLFLMIGMVLLQYLSVGNLFSSIGYVLRNLLSGFVTFLLGLLKRDASYDLEVEKSEEIEVFPLEAGETSVFAYILEEVIKTAIYLVLILGAVYITVRILYELYKKFYDNQKLNTDISEFLLQNILDIEHISGIKQRKKRSIAATSDEKIRRMYKKYVKRSFNMKEIVSKAFTPTEIEVYIYNNKQREVEKNISIFAKNGQNQIINRNNNKNKNILDNDIKMTKRVKIYEKARYSGQQCSKEDVEEMKRNI